MTSKLRTRLCDELGIDYPIILAGMGSKGRATPPPLVAAVSEAGGLGVLGGSALDPEEIRGNIREVRRLTAKPFGLDLLLPASMAESVANREEVRERLRREFPNHVAMVDELRQMFGLPYAEAQGDALSPELIRSQVDVAIEEKVPVFASGLGDPGWVVPRVKGIGGHVIGLVGSVRQAQRQMEAGVDYIVAQGAEAGGHTGRIGTFPLIPQVVDAVAPTPVIAAGGIADGRGLVAALALGAVGIWCGTLFLTATESRLRGEHQHQILSGRSEDFVVTRAYTGKTARDYKNEVIEAWERSGLSPLPMPLQGVLMDDFNASAEAAGRYELMNNPSGQVGGMLNERRPAAQIVRDIVEQAADVLNRLAQ